jgi:hypothetical protein
MSLKNSSDRILNKIFGSELIWDLTITADVFVYSEKEFEEWKNEFNSIPETAIHTGKEIDLANF